MQVPLFPDLYLANQIEKKGGRQKERKEERKE